MSRLSASNKNRRVSMASKERFQEETNTRLPMLELIFNNKWNEHRTG
jgi:hypothetical protein